jgi:small subunit ribosomal protein S6
MNAYELMYIVHPDADEDSVTGINEQVSSWISDQSGQVVKTEVWGRRKLAYPIKKQLEGTYVVMDVELAGTALAEVERNMTLHEQILRYMVVREGH